MSKKEKKETMVLNHKPQKKVRITKEFYSTDSSRKTKQASDKLVTSSMTFTINIY